MTSRLCWTHQSLQTLLPRCYIFHTLQNESAAAAAAPNSSLCFLITFSISLVPQFHFLFVSPNRVSDFPSVRSQGGLSECLPWFLMPINTNYASAQGQGCLADNKEDKGAGKDKSLSNWNFPFLSWEAQTLRWLTELALFSYFS